VFPCFAIKTILRKHTFSLFPEKIAMRTHTSRFRLFALCAMLLAWLSACTELPSSTPQARILTMGDSMMAWNSASGQSVSHQLERLLNEPVVDRSVTAARVHYILPISGGLGMKIASQYTPGRWDWVVMNGGGNDLLFGCGCGLCEGTLDRLISKDGRSGTIPQTVAKARSNGAQVIYVGYMRTPGRGSVIDGCRAAGDDLEDRLAQMASLDKGTHFVGLKTMIPSGDLTFHAADRVHPSPKGSQAIAARIAAIIRTNP
jgi:acyl-CoA thioesterase I